MSLSSEKNHWVLVPFHLFGTIAFPNPMWIGNVGITYKLLRVWVFFIYPSFTLTESISVPPSLYRRFYIVLNSTWHDLWFIGDAFHLVWWIKCLEYLGSENISQAGPGGNVSSYHPISRSSLDANKSSECCFHLMCKARWIVCCSLRGFACAICVSVQH